MAGIVKEEGACKAVMLMYETSISMVDESSIGEVQLLIAVVQQMRHSRFDIEDHLAEHTISPAEPATSVSPWWLQSQDGWSRAHHDRVNCFSL